MYIKIGISGLGFVGSAMMLTFIQKGYIEGETLFVYDKYKDGGIGCIDGLIHTDILFLALPTLFNFDTRCFDIGSIDDNLKELSGKGYNGIVVIKSTIEPLTTQNFCKKYNLNIVFCPEFLSAKTAFYDFLNQKHIIIGKTDSICEDKLELLINFFVENFKNAEITLCSSTEAECVKLFSNNFYSVKIQFFTEMFLLCDKIGINFDKVRDTMLKNSWINPMHTQIPGSDGNISYGGNCFPKDTNALLHFMINKEVPHNLLKACIEERDLMRNDNLNIKKM